MKQTKMFNDTLAYSGWIRVDEQINNFVKKNDYKIVDVKYQRDSHKNTNYALLIYEVQDNE